MTRRSVQRIAISVAALVFGAVAFTIYGQRTRTASVEARTTQTAAPQIVPVAEVIRTDLSRTVKLTAEFTPFQDVDVMSKVAGYVKQIYVDVGDRVKEGQLLATLEVPEMADELAKASASINRSTAEVAHARDEIRRAESAHQMVHLSYTRLAAVMQSRPGLIAQQEIDDAHSRDLVAEAQVSAAQSNLAAAEEAVGMNRADQAKTKTLIAYTRVAAPFSGVVTKRYADTGAMIQAGTASQTQARPLVRLAQSSMLRLILPVPESMVPSIHLGQSVDVTVPSLGRTLPGRVARFAHEVDRSTRTMQTEVDVPNPNYVLIPGMYAEVSLALERRDHVLSIPLGAIDPGEEVSKVFVVTPAGTVEIRDVALGIETADRAEIRSGVKQGEFVITGKRAGLKPGQHVTPKLTVSAKSA
jgi:RND family efflux transporter MFP subunit